MSVSTETESAIRDLAEPIASSLGLFVYDVEVISGQGSGMIRVVVERLASDEDGAGVTIEELTNMSRELSYMLDVEDPVAFSYRLEVSSPGVERKLRTEEHFLAAIGEEVRVILRQPTPDRHSVLEGTLVATDGDAEMAVEDEKGTVRAFPIRHVKKAHTRYDFDQKDSGKSGNKKSKVR